MDSKLKLTVEIEAKVGGYTVRAGDGKESIEGVASTRARAASVAAKLIKQLLAE